MSSPGPFSDKPESAAIAKLQAVEQDLDAGEINELAVVAEGEEKTSWFVWSLVFCAAISGLLFGASLGCILFSRLILFQGYDTGVISGALVVIKDDLGGKALTNGQKVCCLLHPRPHTF